MVVGPLVSRPLLLLLNTPESIIDWCADYLNIFFLGIAGFSYYNILAGILRGLGDSVSALVFLLISTVLNVVLDILFVAGFGMGVPAVALATVIKLGLPSGLTQAIFSLAMIVVQSLMNSFGEMVIACNVIVMRVDGFAMMPNFSFGSALTTFTGQNIGAKRMDRVEQGTKHGTIMAVAVSTVLTMLLLLFGHHLMGIFTDTPELVELSMRMLRILAFGYITVAVTQSLSGVMRGAGDTMTPMWISLISTVIIRVPLAYGLAYVTRSPLYPTGRPESTFVSLLISWSLGAAITYGFYRKGAWREKGISYKTLKEAA